MASLSTQLAEFDLRNPLLPGVGPIVRDGNSLIEVANKGAGALVSDTVSVEPSEDPRPNMAKMGDSIMSAKRWSEISLEQWVNEEYPKAKDTGLPLIASIGFTPEQIEEVAPKVSEAGVDALELSTRFFLEDSDSIVEAVETAKSEVDIPVFVKLGLDVDDIVDVSKKVEKAGADGIVAINPIGLGLNVEVNTERPVLGSERGYGWLSGAAAKPLALRCVADISNAVDIPIIGAGGVTDEQDVAEFIMLGASAVQISAAAIIRGTKIFGLIADDLTRFMNSRGYDTVEDMRGAALRNLPEETLRTTAEQPEVLTSQCSGSSLCKKYCPYDAVKIVGGTARIDSANCTGCGLCVSVCPNNAIRF